MDSNEYRSAADAIEGYGEQQADHGSALAAGTSTPLSGSNSGIAGAISMIAQGTVQKIVTDVTSTTQGFANDTAKGLRMQADKVDRLESDLVSHARSILNDPQGAVFGGGLTSGGGYSGAATSGFTGYGGAMPATVSSNPLDTGAQLIEDSNGESAVSASEAGVIGQAESQESMSTMPFGQMRAGGAAGAGAAEERGRRPGYLKAKAESTDDRAKKATAEHLKDCGMAPISIGQDRLVCAKCGSIIELGGADAEALAA
ncbi:MAG TPA: hypothetical protein VFN97_08585 [Actinospica sp.]|nr:hypothetical protein [Actinospica sp.]